MGTKHVAAAFSVVAAVCVLAAGNVAAAGWWSDAATEPDARQATGGDAPKDDTAALPDRQRTVAEEQLSGVLARVLPGAAPGPISRWSDWCSAPQPALVWGEQAEVRTADHAVTVRIAVTRPGEASAWTLAARGLYPDCIDATYLSGTGPVPDSVTVTHAQISAYSTWWRRGDILLQATVVSTSDTPDGSSSSDETVAIDDTVAGTEVATTDLDVTAIPTLLDEAVVQAVGDVCADISGTAESAYDDQGRNPYRDDYTGYFARVTHPGFTIPDGPWAQAGTFDLPEPAWAPAVEPQPVPSLAPYLPGEPGDNPDPETAPRGPAPLLIDPAILADDTTAPEEPRKPLPSPAPPQERPQDTVTSREPREDATGPGCGWAFTSTVPPLAPTASDIDPTSDYVASAEMWTRWLTGVAHYRYQQQKWRDVAPEWADRVAYEEWRTQVEQAWQDAEQQLRDSRAAWEDSIQPDPAPTPTPQPTTPAEPSPTPTPVPSEEPAP